MLIDAPRCSSVFGFPSELLGGAHGNAKLRYKLIGDLRVVVGNRSFCLLRQNISDFDV
jgi:hypothetical protein